MELRFEELTRAYEGKKVLDLKAGAIVSGSRTGVIGPNGAGKSTLLNLIGGLDRADGGRIYYDGQKQIPKNEITQVFQTPYLITTTVEKNIAYPLKLRGWGEDEIEERVAQLCQELDLTGMRKKKAWKLSGGETQKVALARALSFHPRLLLLDEPTANIDPSTTAEIEKMLIKINEEEKTTVVLVTHNLAQAKRTCDRCLFLKSGQLIETGRADQILANPKEELTRKFIAGELLI
ncbi:ATP-binding cassette domain-containing protein [Ihubacter massiliensis]|uniref:ATP-binding cassette domain-containing protein n=1 Tax=Hominibacterium faecale TaxID=2839743 RepID=A0A9J6QYR8_9FIRM|nr:MULTISPECIES: ATP-binding cassette domain-containing protein [Eubacteriales Family XIII. Incertae Sedis]MCO7123558.1 ATP-binding cassette domain-containing protein [Ihubacter massiliensis]MCU7380654.1 ATP-binding cassette domain-containing protein [Hominibacterium faecale]